MVASRFLMILLSSLISVYSASKAPNPWPYEFSIKFETNITTNASDTEFPVSGISYYDWNIKSQRIDHGAGNYECAHFYNSTMPCTIYFLSDGMYRLLQEPLPEGQEECCLDLPGIGATPPDWTSSSNPTFEGFLKDPYSGIGALEWIYDSLPNEQSEYHKYYEVAPGTSNAGRPLIFTFPGADGRQDYHYIPSTLEEGPQMPSLFVLPDGCAGKPCSTDSYKKRNIK